MLLYPTYNVNLTVHIGSATPPENVREEISTPIYVYQIDQGKVISPKGTVKLVFGMKNLVV